MPRLWTCFSPLCRRGSTRTSSPPQTAPETCQRVAVLYQKEEVAMRYVGEIPLSLGEYGLRDGLVVYGKFLPDGFDFTLVVVHLKAYSDPRSTSIREEELSLLGQWVQTHP